MRLERETPGVSATAFIANRPSATRSAAISVFLSPLWKGLRGGFRPPSSCDRACAPAPGRDPPVSSLPNSRQPARQIHGCSTSLAQEPAPPIKQIGRDAMTASGRRYRLAGFKTLLNDCQLLLGCPPPAANITRQQFNVSIVVRHKPIPKPVLEPFCLCRLSGRNGGQFSPAMKVPRNGGRISHDSDFA